MSDNLLTLNIPENDRKRVVILGGGFAGINLVKNLSDKFQVVLLDSFNYHTFQPLLYQVATAGLEPDSIAGPLRKILKNKKDAHFRMLHALSINPEANEVETAVGKLTYDYLVIATGSKTNYFGIEGIKNNAFVLKTVPNALDLRSHIFQQFESAVMTENPDELQKHLTFAVVGGGPTGVEVCGALAELKNKVLPKDYPTLDLSKMKIILIEGLPKILPAMNDNAGKKAASYLKKLGVDLYLDTLTKDYDGDTVTLNNGESIKTNTVIWAAGVVGNSPKGIPEQSIEKGKITVNEFNQVIYSTESGDVYDNVFAIGDVSSMKAKKYPKGLPGLAQVAIQQGKHLTKNLKRKEEGLKLLPFNYKNKGELATVGRNKAVADLKKMRFYGFAGWFIWMVVHIMFLIGFRSKMVVFVNWLWNYLSYDKGIRLIVRPYYRKKDGITRIKHREKEMA